MQLSFQNIFGAYGQQKLDQDINNYFSNSNKNQFKLLPNFVLKVQPKEDVFVKENKSQNPIENEIEDLFAKAEAGDQDAVEKLIIKVSHLPNGLKKLFMNKIANMAANSDESMKNLIFERLGIKDNKENDSVKEKKSPTTLVGVIEETNELFAKAQGGDKEALEKIIQNLSLMPNALKKIFMNKIAGMVENADDSMKEFIFEKLGSKEVILAAFVYDGGKHAEQAAEKLVDKIDIDPAKRRVTWQDVNVLPYTHELEEKLLKQLEKNPSQNIGRIEKFKYTMAGVEVLGKFASEKPNSTEGTKAAHILADSVMNGDKKVSRAALGALQESAIKGNKASIQALKKIIMVDRSQRAILAVDALTNVAMQEGSGSASPGSALGTLLELAENKSLNKGIRRHIIKNLKDMASQGKCPDLIIERLTKIAQTDDPYQEASQSLKELTKKNKKVA